MRFIVSSSYLLKKLQIIGGVINSNNTMSILENFLFELSENKLTVSASDLETTIKGVIEVESTDTASIVVPYKILIDTLKTFTAEQALTFTINDNNTIDIVSNNGKYTLAYLDSQEFPTVVEIENANRVTLRGDILATAIQSTFFATGNDDLRPIMNGVFFNFTEEALIFAATDAHKLVKYERQDIKSEQPAAFVIPKKPLNLLKGILSQSETQVTIEYNESNAKFSFDQLDYVCRLIDGTYPNYEAVIPKENPNKLIVNRTLLLNSTKRISNFASKATHQMRVKITGNSLQIFAEDIEYNNRANETIPCNYEGDDMEIGFNSKFFMEMLSNLSSEDILLEMSYSNRPGILTPADGLDEGEKIYMLVMPTMLSNENV
ncbi:MAG: DNA polymerase III subunit beta [Capnocytophaga sp.]|jgi:DNA polymerase III, beta subunit|uniref:DNA polymerase III subunit beta n=1 Tax=Capnocytophaga sp. oral taxon 863 TaxID=1227265 RepID=UPI000397EE5E|nr:DNA polymerase III subunit beta [Capnocytophaga sp. oral taxon 863]ERI64636.1 DNA polymerase III, beta subunit [Capnocytophaga sp. oral taxon 863 str. F0517]RKW13561.1 MAG: DNA polymerase III subunit beta [Capnocytophaga sp.]